MKKIVILFLLITFFINHVNAQQLQLRKSVARNLDDFDLSENELVRVIRFQFPNAASKRVGIQKVSLGNNKIMNLNPNEKLIRIDGDNVYITRSSPHGERALIKLVRGAESAKLIDDFQTQFKVLNTAGNVVTCNFIDGEATTYSFFSDDFRLINRYMPYPGFVSISAQSEKFISIYSQPDRSSDMYKMAILDHSGELKTEREFPRNKYYPANIKMSNGRIFLLLSNTTRAGSLLVCFDLDLNIVWQRETPKGLIGNEFSLSKTANTILVNTQDEVACWNTSSGIDLWRVPTSEFEGVGDRMITSQFVIEDSYAAVLIGKYIASMGFTNNMLIVLNADNGQRLFSDTLPDTQTFAEILTAGNRFLLSADQQILVYEK